MINTRVGIAFAGFGAVGMLVAGCGSSSSGGDTSATSPQAGAPGASTPATTQAPPAASAADAATFDGDFTGKLTMNLCTNASQGSVKATVDGDSATNYLGSVTKTELNFMGPGGGVYSTNPGTSISVSNGTFNVDGLTLTDELLTHKSVTVHGDLSCP